MPETETALWKRTPTDIEPHRKVIFPFVTIHKYIAILYCSPTNAKPIYFTLFGTRWTLHYLQYMPVRSVLLFLNSRHIQSLFLNRVFIVSGATASFNRSLSLYHRVTVLPLLSFECYPIFVFFVR